MNARQIEAVVAGIGPVIKTHIDELFAPFAARLKALEERGVVAGEPGKPGEKGDPGPAGKDVTVDDVAPLIAAEVAKAIAELPVPKDGEPGPRGEKGAAVTVDDVAPLVAAEVTKAVAALPVPAAGEPGKPGEKGEPGPAGTSVTPDEVAPLIVEVVAKAVAALPAPKDGEPGPRGEKGEPGPMGHGVTVDEVVPLIASEVEKAFDALPAPAAGEAGKPGEKGEAGRDGRDASDIPMLKGFIAEQVTASVTTLFKGMSFTTPDDGRTFVFGAEFGDQKISHEIKTALVLDRGVWRQALHAKGDGVTWGGSFWIAQKDTETKPDTPDSDWRLGVKRGRDGASTYDVARKGGYRGTEKEWLSSLKGEPGPQGPRGEQGPRGYGG